MGIVITWPGYQASLFGQLLLTLGFMFGAVDTVDLQIILVIFQFFK